MAADWGRKFSLWLQPADKPADSKSLMEQYQVRFKSVLARISLSTGTSCRKSSLCPASADQFVLEIGTGLGALTYALAQACRQVLTFEIDPDLAAIFRENQALDNIHLVAATP